MKIYLLLQDQQDDLIKLSLRYSNGFTEFDEIRVKSNQIYSSQLRDKIINVFNILNKNKDVSKIILSYKGDSKYNNLIVDLFDFNFNDTMFI